jgi:hypothetical protein
MDRRSKNLIIVTIIFMVMFLVVIGGFSAAHAEDVVAIAYIDGVAIAYIDVGCENLYRQRI